jgi:regulator of protease activity HflC (stomatin/prohibitin superfamily)
MSYIMLAVLVTAIGLIALLMAMGRTKKLRAIQVEGGSVHGHGWALPLSTVVVLLLAFNILFAGWNSTYQVPAGHVGIIYRFGAIVGQTGEGLQFVPPWETVVPASTQEQSRYYKQLDSFSKETQNVYVAATVNFHVSPGKIQELYRTVGSNYAKILIDPRVYQDFKDATVQYSSVDIAPHRDDIRRSVRQRITDELKAHSIIVDDVLLQNIRFDRQFEASIENKQVQSQNALAAAEQVKVKHQEALQKIETAKGDAAAALIKAQKEAQANDVLTKSITPQLIKYLTVQKLAPDVRVMMVPAGNQFILGSDLLSPHAGSGGK